MNGVAFEPTELKLNNFILTRRGEIVASTPESPISLCCKIGMLDAFVFLNKNEQCVQHINQLKNDVDASSFCQNQQWIQVPRQGNVHGLIGGLESLPGETQNVITKRRC